jgi:hypothetical protein
VKKVKRKNLSILLVLTATMILACNFSTVFATTTYVDNEHAGGSAIINLPDHTPWVRIVAFGQMNGDYYSRPPADRFQLYVRTGGTDAAPTFTVVAGYEDNAVRSAFSASLGLGTVEHVVKNGQIQVIKDEVTNAIIIRWNIPLEFPATASTPAITIPPGKLVIEPTGDLRLGSVGFPNPVSLGSAGWKVQYTYHYYFGTASFFCQDWNCKWVSVGQGFSGSLQPTAVMDRVWTWTHT